MGSNSNNHQLNIDGYMQKMLYTNLTVTTNQKPVIDMQKIKRKESKYIQRKPTNHDRSKRRKEQERTTKTTIKQVTKWQ